MKSFQFRPGLRYHVEEIGLTGNASILQTVTHTFNLDSLPIYRIHVNENIHFLKLSTGGYTCMRSQITKMQSCKAVFSVFLSTVLKCYVIKQQE